MRVAQPPATLDLVSTAISVTATTTSGAVQGLRTGDVVAFLGVPYAAAPVGDRRFRAPEPALGWSGIRKAVAHGPTPPMPGYPRPIAALVANPAIPGDEYLNLSVWTPDPGAHGLPVLVWVPGGGFVNGSNAVPVTDGSAFARDGVVTVAINYRLGVEGFALLPDAPPNLGLLDQVAALEWVRDNIAAFGGDPDIVTVAGESAGAMSIGALLAMPRATGLFRRAVLQSGAAHHTLRPATASRVTEFVAAQLEVPGTAAALRDVPSEQIIAAQKALFRELRRPDPARWREVVTNIMPFEPVVDGDVLPGPPLERIAAGSAAGVDVLVGSNRHEYRFFVVPTGVVDRADEALLAAVAASYRLPPAAVQRYQAASPAATPGLVMSEIATDWFYRIPSLRLAEAVSGSNVYEFGWEAPSSGLGACHYSEVPFVFDTLTDPGAAPLVGPAPPRALAEAMHQAWVTFAATGDPGWSAYTPDRRAVARFGNGDDPGWEVVEDPRGDLRELWDGIR